MKQKAEKDVLSSDHHDEAQYLLDDYNSEEEGLSGTKASSVDVLSAATKELMSKYVRFIQCHSLL